MTEAITFGHLDVVKFLYGRFGGVKCIECALESAVQGGHFNVVFWMEALLQRQRPICKRIHTLRFETMQWVKSERLMKHTVQIGRMKAFEWLHRLNRRVQLFQWFVFFAGQAGDLELTQWLYERQEQAIHQERAMLPEYFRTALNQALRNGHREVAEFYLDRGILPPSLREAVVHGHAALVDALIKKNRGEPWCRPEGLEDAFKNGHMEVVRLMDPIGTIAPFSAELYDALFGAAKHGDMALLKFYWSRDMDVIEWLWTEALISAVVANQLEATQFIYERITRHPEFEYNEVMRGVEYAHNFDALSWLFQQKPLPHGFFFTTAINRAAALRHCTLIKQLHEQGALGFTSDAMDRAAAAGSLRIVKFLHEHRLEGCTKAAMDSAAAGGFLRVVQFLHESRHEGCTTEAMDQAATNGHFRVVQFLHSHRSEGCTAKAMDGAKTQGHLQVVRFLERLA